MWHFLFLFLLSPIEHIIFIDLGCCTDLASTTWYFSSFFSIALSSFTSYPTLFLYICNLVILIVVARTGMLYGFAFYYLIRVTFFTYYSRRLLVVYCIPYIVSLPMQSCNFNCYLCVTIRGITAPLLRMSQSHRGASKPVSTFVLFPSNLVWYGRHPIHRTNHFGRLFKFTHPYSRIMFVLNFFKDQTSTLFIYITQIPGLHLTTPHLTDPLQRDPATLPPRPLQFKCRLMMPLE